MSDSKSGGKIPKESTAQPATDDPPATDRIVYGDQYAHLAFQQQLVEMLSRADITEEQRQQILIAATCPCCGAGGLSLSLDIKSDRTPQF